MKTKQNKTKQLANACETITHSLVANAKAVTITLMLFFTMLVSPVVAQPPTLPDDYYDQAYMGDDADVEQQLTFENAFWQILYDSEIADCVTDNNIKIFSFITISGNSYENGPITPITVPVDQSNWSGDYELDVATLLGLAGLGSDPGTYFVSHMACEWSSSRRANISGSQYTNTNRIAIPM